MPKVTLMNGAIFSVAKTYGTDIVMSGLSNATEAVATLAASHGVVVGDFLEINTGWGDLDKMIVRVKAVTTNDVTLEGGVFGATNTSDLTRFPAGSGAGTVRKITAWQNIDNIKEPNISGGEMQSTDITVLSDRRQRNAPTIASAIQAKLTIMDDPTMAWYSTVSAAAKSQTPIGLRITYKNGSMQLCTAYAGFTGLSNGSMNAALTTELTFDYLSELVRYAS